jgi:hypothetical protein
MFVVPVLVGVLAGSVCFWMGYFTGRTVSRIERGEK